MLEVSTAATVPKRFSELITSAFTAEECRALSRMLETIDQFRLLRNSMSIHELSALLRVALEEGGTVRQYADASGVHPSLMARHLMDLGEKTRKGEPGLMLVEPWESPTSKKEYNMHLTVKGRALLTRVARRLNGDRV